MYWLFADWFACNKSTCGNNYELKLEGLSLFTSISLNTRDLAVHKEDLRSALTWIIEIYYPNILCVGRRTFPIQSLPRTLFHGLYLLSCAAVS